MTSKTFSENKPIYNKMYKIVFIGIVISVLLSSCHLKKTKMVDEDFKNFYLSTIQCVDILSKSDSIDCKWNHSTNKIVVYYDSINCAPCELKLLPRWRHMILEMKEYRSYLDFVFIFNTSNKEEIKSVFEEFGFEFLFYCDTNGDFKKCNNIPKNSLYHTFLLNKNNEVVLIGSPIGNSSLWDLYKKTISDFQKE